jgi:hypothetical protein
VLYRRWPHKDDLVLDAIHHYGATHPVEIPDTGSLRGEIDLDKTPRAVLTMPFDLMRHDMLMTYRRIPPERILTIVDDLFMPLVAINRPR